MSDSDSSMWTKRNSSTGQFSKDESCSHSRVRSSCKHEKQGNIEVDWLGQNSETLSREMRNRV